MHWYERERVFGDAALALVGADIEDFLQAMGRAIGAPWQAKHKARGGGRARDTKR